MKALPNRRPIQAGGSCQHIIGADHDSTCFLPYHSWFHFDPYWGEFERGTIHFSGGSLSKGPTSSDPRRLISRKRQAAFGAFGTETLLRQARPWLAKARKLRRWRRREGSSAAPGVSGAAKRKGRESRFFSRLGSLENQARGKVPCKRRHTRLLEEMENGGFSEDEVRLGVFRSLPGMDCGPVGLDLPLKLAWRVPCTGLACFE